MVNCTNQSNYNKKIIGEWEIKDVIDLSNNEHDLGDYEDLNIQFTGDSIFITSEKEDYNYRYTWELKSDTVFMTNENEKSPGIFIKELSNEKLTIELKIMEVPLRFFFYKK